MTCTSLPSLPSDSNTTQQIRVSVFKDQVAVKCNHGFSYNEFDPTDTTRFITCEKNGEYDTSNITKRGTTESTPCKGKVIDSARISSTSFNRSFYSLWVFSNSLSSAQLPSAMESGIVIHIKTRELDTPITEHFGTKRRTIKF